MKKVFVLKGLVVWALLMLSTTAFAAPLTVYSSVDEENGRAILAAFTRATGVEVEAVFLSSGPAMSRIESEKAEPQADVWFGAPAENHVLAKEQDLTQSYIPKEVKNLAPFFKDPDGYWHAFYMNPLGLGVLTQELAKTKKPAPKTWQDLLKPPYKGIIQMPSPQSSGTAYSLVCTLIELWGEEKAFDFMKKLHPNIQAYTQSGTGPAQSLAAGETQIAIQFTPGLLKLAGTGFPVDVFFPEEGVGFEAAAISILQGAKNLEAAKTLVDWIISKNGQRAIVEAKTYFFPVRGDVSAEKGLPTLHEIKLINYDREKAAQNKKRIVDRWLSEVSSEK
ncbi:MAG: ABC transporter substrate-binding protein [Synergistaceae bacterium]|jgi:iron(III) transport system substrate-binding protein|nr:ABC transporter substrate-binding protein [Synergistaceae bacterium]